MEKKTSIRGSILALKVGGKPLKLSREEYKPSSIRSIAYGLKEDTGYQYGVSVQDGIIIVTRKS